MQTRTVFDPTWRTFTSQVGVLTKANMKSRYRKTVAGFLWVIINPLVMYFVQSQIFSKFLKLGIPNYYMFLLGGLLPWIFMNQSLEMGTPTIQWNAALLKSYPTNPLVYVTSQIVDNFINFLAAFTVILVPVSFLETSKLAGLALLPLPMITLALATAGMVWFFATMQVFFRDTKFILSFVLSITYFVTPVFYPIEYVPSQWRWIITINPFYVLIAPFRACIYEFDLARFGTLMIPATVLAIGFPALAFLFWRMNRHELYFNL
jgi:lipopolysaccharide transport system permease protein